ncbi:MAG TPA: TorF family putative porin [Bacteroidales bacterium]|jgi:Bacterial protein of unknown function (Gcw_chp)
MKRNYAILITSAYFLFAIMLINPASAQEKTSKGKLDISADLKSRYIWRGLNLGGSSPSIQPGMEYNRGNFTVGAWGAYSFSNTTIAQEADLYLSWSIADKVSFTVTDYFLPKEDTLNNYFNYTRDKTNHLFELSAKFLGTEQLPLSLLIAINVHGADAKKSNGDIQYSTYIELGYSFKINETGCSAFIGFTPNNPDGAKGETGFYGPGAGVINLGLTATKEIKITDSFSLPVNASLITNPQTENIFLVFGISL